MEVEVSFGCLYNYIKIILLNMYTINLIEKNPWYINLELFKDWKVETFCDTNISKKFLYQFWEEYVKKVLKNTCLDLEKENNIKSNKLYNIFADNFLVRDEFITSFNWFVDNIISTNFLNKNDKNIKERLIWAYFNIIQFKNKQWFLNAKTKLISLIEEYKECGENIYLDNLYFKYIYKIDKYNAEESRDLLSIKWFQDEEKMLLFYNNIFDIDFLNFITRKNIDLICVIPNNIVRKISFNHFIFEKLKKDFKNINIFEIKLNEYKWREAQKSIMWWLCNRIKNAEKLFTLEQNYWNAKNILLIDDVFWSGATMNTVAKKLKKQNSEVNIIWFSLLWSYRKWFDIINEI